MFCNACQDGCCNSSHRALHPVGARFSMSSDANQTGSKTSKHPDHFLAEWREYRGLSQRELAVLIDESNSKISRIENGETELRPRFAKKIAKFFNIPLAALFTVNPQGEGRIDAEMLDAIGEMDASDKPAALRMLRGMSSRRGSDQAG